MPFNPPRKLTQEFSRIKRPNRNN